MTDPLPLRRPTGAGSPQPHVAAGPRPVTNVCGREKAARQGVLSALRSDSHPTGHARHNDEDPTPQRPGIRVYAPPVYRHHYDGARWSKRYGDTPTAAYACACGQTRTARGPDAVAALVADYEAHKHFCTGTPAPHTERRNAA